MNERTEKALRDAGNAILGEVREAHDALTRRVADLENGKEDRQDHLRVFSARLDTFARRIAALEKKVERLTQRVNAVDAMNDALEDAVIGGTNAPRKGDAQMDAYHRHLTALERMDAADVRSQLRVGRIGRPRPGEEDEELRRVVANLLSTYRQGHAPTTDDLQELDRAHKDAVDAHTRKEPR